MKHRNSIAFLTIGSALVLAGAAFAGDGGKHGGRGHHGGPMKHLLAQMDANQDGSVTREEARSAAQKLFATLDQNGDGTVTEAEASEGMRALRQRNADERFAKKDANGDGRLSLEESKMPERRFQRLDANSDGALTKEELSQAFAGKGERGSKHFGKLDADQDGNVTQAEALAAAEARFQRLDKNGDGVLTSDELRPPHKRERRGGAKGDGEKPARDAR